MTSGAFNQHDRELISSDVGAWLAGHEAKEMLRFITCGSVDDGKSTLIGRLLYDSRQIFDDQLASLEADSKRVGTQGQKIDFALLVDGLAAERPVRSGDGRRDAAALGVAEPRRRSRFEASASESAGESAHE
jgi:GTPase